MGVIRDHKLCWKPCLEYIIQKLSKFIAVLYKTRDLLNKKCLHILYCSLIMPYMSHCVTGVWGNVYKTNVDPLIKLQNRAIRIIHKVCYCESINPLFILSCMLRFWDTVYLKTLELFFLVRNKSLPIFIQHFLLREGNYNLRGLCIFETCKVRTNVKYRCVSVLGVLVLVTSWKKSLKM